MLKLFLRSAVLVLALAAFAAQANLILFTATLTGSQETPPTASPASGFGTVLLNDVLLTITVDESWSGLTTPATASHIHCCVPPGFSASVLFPLAGVPAATSGAIPEQTFAITAAQIVSLEAGLFYLNIHSSTYPGGEIRGQLLRAPEPMTLALLGLGALAAFGAGARRRKAAP